MSYEINSLKRVMYQIENSGSYAVNLSGTSNYADLAVLEGAEFTTAREMLPINLVQQFVDAHAGSAPGLKSSGANFSMYLQNNGTALSGANAPNKPALVALLETVMGGYYAFSGSGFKAYSAHSVFDTNNQTNFVGGGGIAYFTSGSPTVPSKYEMNRVLQRDATHIWLYTSASSPGGDGVILTGSTINNCYNVFLTEDPQLSLQLHVMGAELDDSWVLAGLQGNFSIDIQLGQLASLGFEMQGATWFTGSNHGGLATATYPTTTPIVFSNGDALLALTASQQAKPQTRTSLHARTITIQPNFSYTDIRSPSGPQTVLRKRRSRNIPPLTVTIDTYFEDKTFYASRDNRDRYALFVQLGRTPGNSVYIQLPNLEIVNCERIDVDGVAGQRLTFNAHHDYITTVNTGNEAIARSPLVISFG